MGRHGPVPCRQYGSSTREGVRNGNHERCVRVLVDVFHGVVDYRSFQRIIKNAGLRRIRLPDRRHTAASVLLAQGVSAVSSCRFEPGSSRGREGRESAPDLGSCEKGDHIRV
jgi:hypothetical protein